MLQALNIHIQISLLCGKTYPFQGLRSHAQWTFMSEILPGILSTGFPEHVGVQAIFRGIMIKMHKKRAGLPGSFELWRF